MRQIRQMRKFITRRVLLSLGIASVALIGTVTFASAHASTAAGGQTALTTNGMCSQSAVIAAEGQVPTLDASKLRVQIPAEEPAIVATVHGTAITAQQLEMRVASIEQNHQAVLAHNPVASMPAALKAVLKESSAQVRQQALTSLIESQLWLAEGKAHGLSASSAQARDAAARFQATAFSNAATSDSRTQFQAYLCVNQLSAASFATDPRVIQTFQASLTINAAKTAVVSGLSPSQQQDQAAVAVALAAHVKALWTADNVHVFLLGFTPAA